MKRISAYLLVAMISTSVLIAGPQPKAALSKARIQHIEKNILANLQNDVLEIRSTTIQLIIDMHKSNIKVDLDFVVIPLLDILKTSEEPELRIYSALALYYLQSDLGKFAVSRRITYDDSPRVSNMCKRLTTHWDSKIKTESNYASKEESKY